MATHWRSNSTPGTEQRCLWSRVSRTCLVVGALFSLLTACEATLTGAELARARAAREYDCPAQRVHVKWLSEGPNEYRIYKVAACGTVATYACNTDRESCIKESDDHR